MGRFINRLKMLSKNSSVLVIMVVMIFTSGGSPVFAENSVYLDVSVNGWPMDAVWVGVESNINIAIGNDVKLGSMSLGFVIYSPDGASWEWISKADGYGPGGQHTGRQAVTVRPGSRMDPASEVWDTSDLLVTEQDMDGSSPDTILLTGLAESGGLDSGRVSSMITLHLYSWGVAGDEVKTFCIDSVYVFPAGDWIFTDFETSEPIVPDFSGPYCWPVQQLPNCAPGFYIVCPISEHLDHCEVGNVSLQGESCRYPIVYYSLLYCTGDGAVNVQSFYPVYGVVTYAPAPSDAGKTIEVGVEICDPFGSGQYCEISFIVPSTSPTLSCGQSFNSVGINNLFTKSDIVATFDAPCNEPEYSIISGSGEIDPAAGVYTWFPAIEDVGPHEVVVRVTDGFEAVQDTFDLEVVAEESWPGNANCNGGVNIGDVVFLLNHIFKDGMVPPILNWADANGDCSINVADAVYLINYIFHDGDAPLPGCVE